MSAPPEWQNLAGDPNWMEQGVISNLGNYPTSGGPQKMKQVGIMPWLGGGEGDAPTFGFNPYAEGVPVFEGRHGLATCAIDPSTGEYRKDASGQNRCWYMPVAAGSTGVVGQGGGMGAWVSPDRDIVHYGSGALGVLVIPLGVSLLMSIAIFAYSIWVTKRVNRKDEPGIIAKLLRWDTWKLWGNKYAKKSHTFLAPDGESNLPLPPPPDDYEFEAPSGEIGSYVKPLRSRKHHESSWVKSFGNGKSYKVTGHDTLDGKKLLKLQTGPRDDEYELVYPDEVVAGSPDASFRGGA